MSTIRAATRADVDAVARYLADALHGDGGPARYRRYLECSWVTPPAELGMLIEDAGQIRGFIGTIYADRRFGAELQRFCNITSVAVAESHRKLTLKLFGALLARKDITFTCFSPSEQITQILDFFKFEHRPGDRVVVGPISGIGVRQLAAAARVRVYTRPEELDAELDADQRQISRDHRGFRCGQLLLADRERRCFLVTVRRGRGVRAFADVLYASDPDMLLDHLPWIHAPLFRAHRTVLTGIDRRWVTHPPRASFTYTKLRPLYARLARAPGATTASGPAGIDRIDTLYSELLPMYGAR
jgi:hypothetical protein